MIHNFKIGADIEAFLQDKETKEIVSAEGIVKGTKRNPFVFDETNKFFATSLDNVLAEHCIPPVTNVDDFVNNIMKSQLYLNSLDDRLCTAFLPSAHLDPKYLQTRNAQTFGCEPDYNAWNDGMPNDRPSAEDLTLRTAGFHVHLGYENPSYEMNILFMKYFDMYVTMPALIIEPENERRLLYGKAGAFRNKDYGMEARTLSSYFASTPELIKWVYQNTIQAIDALNNGVPLVENVEEIINNCDIDSALLITQELNILTTIAA